MMRKVSDVLKNQYFVLKICFSLFCFLYLHYLFCDFDVSKSSLEVGSSLHQPLLVNICFRLCGVAKIFWQCSPWISIIMHDYLHVKAESVSFA